MASSERMMPYRQAADLLQAYGVPLAAGELVGSPSLAAEAAARLGFPVALKAVAPALTHKSDAGLVRLNLASQAEVQRAGQAMLAAVAGHECEGLLVQQMVTGGVEMIVGVTNDPQFGPVLALGSGGLLVELLDDVVLRLPPLTLAEAAAMVRETRSWPLLRGYRGRSPADVDALARLLVDVGRLAAQARDRVLGLDLNPVMVLPQGQGVQVVDLRVVQP